MRGERRKERENSEREGKEMQVEAEGDESFPLFSAKKKYVMLDVSGPRDHTTRLIMIGPHFKSIDF